MLGEVDWVATALVCLEPALQPWAIGNRTFYRLMYHSLMSEFQYSFRNLKQCFNYAAMFLDRPAHSRLHIYFKSKEGLRFGDSVPRVGFTPTIWGVHVIIVLSMKDTMELSTVSNSHSRADRSGDDSVEIANYAWHLMAPQDDEMWFECSKPISMCNFLTYIYPTPADTPNSFSMKAARFTFTFLLL